MASFSVRAWQTAIQRTVQSAAAWGLLATAMRVFSGLLVLPLMVRLLPSDHLGLWYVFLSLQGIAALFDLGFAPAVTRAVGYLWAGASELKPFGVDAVSTAVASSQPNYSLLNDLVSTMRLYYRVFGFATALVMFGAGGAWVWHKTGNFPDAGMLRSCYAVFVFGAFLTATGDLWPALLSGINGVRRAQQLLLGSALINASAITIGLLNHLDLWALVAGSVGGGLFLRIAGRASFLRALGSHYGRVSVRLQLIRRLWPMAWRSGLVSLGGYLVLSANTLICSAFLSLKVTASYGLSLSVLAILASGASILTQIKLPIVNQLRILGRTDHIIDLWIRRTRLSIVCYVTGAITVVLAGDTLLHLLGSQTAFLPTAQFMVAAVILGLEMHHVLYAGLVSSENQNPFVRPALISGAATLSISLFLTSKIGVWGILLAQGGVQASFNNWWTVYRGIQGLGLSASAYWQKYFRAPLRI